MLAYKFRGQSQIAFALDILFKNRLYCADWKSLNDPLEGHFVVGRKSTDDNDYSHLLEGIRDEKQPIKVCSLSRTFDCHLLWAHYAEGFRGVAIEVDLPEGAPELVEVAYRGVFAYLDLANAGLPREEARRILSSKYEEWSYEQEVRIITENAYYNLPNPVRRIICGHRMEPSLFETLRIVCEHKNIRINRIGIGDEGLDADSVPKLGEPW